jgi:hypothetical protein
MLMIALAFLVTQEDITKPTKPSTLRDYCIKIGLCEPLEPPVIKLTEKGRAYNDLYWNQLAK